MPIDVSGVQLEARDIVERAARTCVAHLGASLATVVAHGSAVKGGYILGSSDIVIALIVDPGIMHDSGVLPLRTVVEIHRDLAQIDPAPFRYLQAHVRPAGAREQAGFITGAYHVVFGDEIVPLATHEELLQNAHIALSRLDPAAIEARLSRHLLDHGEDRLYRELRFMCTDVWPTLHHVVALIGSDAVTEWGLTKPSAIARIDPASEVGQSIRSFYRTVTEHYHAGETVATALEALMRGIEFLDAAAAWYQVTHRQTSDSTRRQQACR